MERQTKIWQVHYTNVDPRLISIIPAVTDTIKSGVAEKIKDFDLYKDELTNRLDP